MNHSNNEMNEISDIGMKSNWTLNLCPGFLVPCKFDLVGTIRR